MHNGAIMSSEVAYLVDTEQPYPVIRLSGVLAPQDASGVRATVLDVLATQPQAVVIDVDQVGSTRRRRPASWPTWSRRPRRGRPAASCSAPTPVIRGSP